MAERGIPFAAVFGNHDDEGGVSKETQLTIYQSYPGCLMSAGPDDITGCGNYNLLVWSSDGSRISSQSAAARRSSSTATLWKTAAHWI